LLYYSCLLFLFNGTSPTQIYPLSLHDALPISSHRREWFHPSDARTAREPASAGGRCDVSQRGARVWLGRRRSRAHRQPTTALQRSEEHTSELQSPDHLVCRLLLEKNNKSNRTT